MRHVQRGGHARLSDGMDEVARWPDDMGRFPALSGRRVSVVAACARACPCFPTHAPCPTHADATRAIFT
eukprot:4701430-Prymnesium_polylepis.1